jgi:hypothetical protein
LSAQVARTNHYDITKTVEEIIKAYNSLHTNESEHVALMLETPLNTQKLFANEEKHKELVQKWNDCLTGNFIAFKDGIVDKLKRSATEAAKNAYKKLTGA